jgi:hypothetical protein
MSPLVDVIWPPNCMAKPWFVPVEPDEPPPSAMTVMSPAAVCTKPP